MPKEAHFLGLIISHGQKCLDPKRLQGLNDLEKPSTIKQLQRFCGTANYQRQWIPKMADHLAYMHELIKDAESRKTWKLNWTEKASEAYDTLLHLMKQDVTLSAFDPKGNIVLETDASDIASGAVLWCNGKIVAFASKKILPKARRISGSPKREFYAGMWAMEHFADFLEGRPFTWRTDAKVVQQTLEQETLLPQFDLFLHHRPYVTV